MHLRRVSSPGAVACQVIKVPKLRPNSTQLVTRSRWWPSSRPCRHLHVVLHSWVFLTQSVNLSFEHTRQGFITT